LYVLLLLLDARGSRQERWAFRSATRGSEARAGPDDDGDL
jgi:hypothetical protein